ALATPFEKPSALPLESPFGETLAVSDAVAKKLATLATPFEKPGAPENPVTMGGGPPYPPTQPGGSHTTAQSDLRERPSPPSTPFVKPGAPAGDNALGKNSTVQLDLRQRPAPATPFEQPSAVARPVSAGAPARESSSEKTRTIPIPFDLGERA